MGMGEGGFNDFSHAAVYGREKGNGDEREGEGRMGMDMDVDMDMNNGVSPIRSPADFTAQDLPRFGGGVGFDFAVQNQNQNHNQNHLPFPGIHGRSGAERFLLGKHRHRSNLGA